MKDRLTGTEAIKVVGQMLRGYPNGGASAGSSYIGALSEVLQHYPRCVTSLAGDLVKGVPRETRFLPTPADVIAWCEREVEHLRGIVDRDDREQRIIREMREREEEVARAAAARKARPTYEDLKAKHGPSWGIGHGDAAEDAARQLSAAQMADANERLLHREYAAAGEAPVEAGHGIRVSRELSQQLREHDGRMAGARSRKQADDRMDSARMIGAGADALAEQQAAE